MQSYGPYLNTWLFSTFPVLRCVYFLPLYLLTPAASLQGTLALKLQTLMLGLITLPKAVYCNLETRLQSPHNRSSKSAGRLTRDVPCAL